MSHCFWPLCNCNVFQIRWVISNYSAFYSFNVYLPLSMRQWQKTPKLTRALSSLSTPQNFNWLERCNSYCVWLGFGYLNHFLPKCMAVGSWSQEMSQDSNQGTQTKYLNCQAKHLPYWGLLHVKYYANLLPILFKVHKLQNLWSFGTLNLWRDLSPVQAFMHSMTLIWH